MTARTFPVYGKPVRSKWLSYESPTPWTGITEGLDARCAECTWAWHQGIYQIKYASRACIIREHAQAAIHQAEAHNERRQQ